jgi:DNA-binding response OmpR family regulator
MTKPFSPREVVQRVRTVLASRAAQRQSDEGREGC